MLFYFICLIALTAAADLCYAPPEFYGTTCTSQEGLVGSRGSKIIFDISSVSGNTAVDCEAVGNGYPGKQAQWGWYDIGVFGDSSYGELCWGANAGKPEIRCKGDPLGGGVDWSWSLSSDPDCE